MDSLFQDIRFALRILRKSPGFTLVAALTLAIGIGANTAMFSVVNSVLLRPLPFADPDQIVSIWQKLPQEDRVSFSPPEFQDWQQQTQVFESLAATTGNGFTLTGRGDPAMIFGLMATPSLFQVLGVTPMLGRTFSPDEGFAGRDHVVLLSYGLWKEQFGGDPNILSQSIMLNGEAYTVVGVMGPEFVYPAPRYRLLVPIALNGGVFQKFRDAHLLRVIGRLKSGVTEPRLQAELDIVGRRIAERDPNNTRVLQHARLHEVQTGSMRTPLLIIMCAVGFVLLIACSNIANLLLARAATRQKEMAIRIAVGARRLRIARQLIVESLLLSIIGGGLGFLLSLWLLDSVVALLPPDLPGVHGLHMDGWVLGFTAISTLGTGLLFGLAPALTSWSSRWTEMLKQGDHVSGHGIGPWLRRGFVFAEITLSVILLSAAGLTLRSFVRLQQVDPGFRPGSVLTASISLAETRYPEAANIRAFYRNILDRLRAIPGARGAAINTAVPFSGQGWGNSVEVEGRPAAPGDSFLVSVQCVSPAYFSTMGIALDNGRDFDDRDSEKGAPVAIIDRRMAESLWPGENPLGKRINLDGPWRTIVGIASSVKRTGLDASEQPQIYVPYPQLSPELTKFLGRGLFLVINSSVEPLALTESVRNSVLALDRQMALTNVSTMEELLQASVAEQRFRTLLLGLFSVMAVILASIGIYGLMSYMVTQRWHEIGIRVALGATRRSILELVLKQALTLTAAGIAVGIFSSLLVARLLSSMLFGISPYDVVTFLGVPLLLVTFAFLASYLPARRAARVDPMITLRYE